MQPHTLNDIFFAIVDRRQERVMLAREADRWLPISSQEFYRNVAGVARAIRWGVDKGDRVAILSENRPEWAGRGFRIAANRGGRGADLLRRSPPRKRLTSFAIPGAKGPWSPARSSSAKFFPSSIKRRWRKS